VGPGAAGRAAPGADIALSGEAALLPDDPAAEALLAQERPVAGPLHPGADGSPSQPVPAAATPTEAQSQGQSLDPSLAQGMVPGMATQAAARPAAEPAAPPPAPRPAPAPIHQVAPIAITLALGPGQAPRLSVSLEPEQLGRVEIRIQRDAGGDTAAIQVLAERPETLALLQRDARELDRALGQAGVVVAEGGMRFELSGGDQAAGGQASGGEPGARRHGGGRHRAAPAEAPPMRRALALSLLDIAV
jgi:Meckel syndrome type 1 protein